MRTLFLSLFGMFALIFTPLKGEEESTIVFVHIGENIPSYLDCALIQARLFNDCKIVLIANSAPLKQYRKFLEKHGITGVACEDLKKTAHHKRFIKRSPLDKQFRDGFWYFASERFFYLDDMMQQYQMNNVVHLESDVMLYVDLSEISPILEKHYSGLGVTFDTDQRCIPGIVFIRNPQVISQLTECMMHLDGKDDMMAIGEFRRRVGREKVKTLPIVQREYIEDQDVDSSSPEDYANLVEEFQSIFDAAYHGQYLGGEDPRNGPAGPGFVNPHCVIKSSLLEYTWERDAEERLVPFAHFQGKKLRINNLHIHCKRLWDFYSIK